MPVYVDKMPFSNVTRAGTIGGIPVTVSPYHPIVFLTLTHPHITSLPSASSSSPARKPSKFPAVVDTGYTGALFLREQHLIAASGGQLTTASLPLAPATTLGVASGSTSRHPQRQLRVWLHPYPVGGPLAALDLGVVHATICLAPAGTSVQPSGPYLPLLGALGFTARTLRVTIDYGLLQLTMAN